MTDDAAGVISEWKPFPEIPELSHVIENKRDRTSGMEGVQFVLS